MTTQTQVIWNLPLSQADIDNINSLEESHHQYEVAPREFIDNTPLPGQRTVNRYWDTLEHAQQWIDLLLPMNPVSAVVVAN